MTEASERPLDGVLVVDLTRHLPGPYASSELLRLGARIVRLEAPGGDPLRLMAPGWHAWLDHGKESVVCDLKRDAAFGRALCASADVILEGFRPGVAERLGVGPDDLPPEVVYCSIRGFAEESEWFERAGHDVNYLGLAGVLDPERPLLPSLPIADLAGGALSAVVRVLAGLIERARTGKGSVHRVSMTEEAHRLVAFRRGGEPAVPALLTGGLACYDLYRCADALWLSVGALEPVFFARLCELLGRPELTLRQFDPGAQPELRETLTEIFGSRPRAVWLALLAAQDTCVAPVLSIAEATEEDAVVDVREPGRDTAAWRDRLGLP